MTPAVAAAAVATAVLLGLSVLQVLVAAGRPYGRLVWGGRHEVLPRSLRVGSALSVPLYAVMAGALLWRARAVDTSPRAVEIAVWVLVGYFALGIVVNGLSRSRPERLVQTPVCVVLTVCALIVARA